MRLRSRSVSSCSVLRYFVPRRWPRVLAFVVLCFIITAQVLLLQNGAMMYIWGSTSKTSTRQLDELIPLGSSRKVKQNEKPDSNVSHSVRQHSLIHSSNFSSTLTTQCKVSHPRIVFFIRMPKCASTSFVSLLQAQAKILSFQFLFNPSGAYDWDNETTKKEAKLIQSKRGKVVYARHFYYVDFELYGLTNFTYITVIREPISRFISSYLYYHYSSKPHIQKMLKPKHKNESLLECVARKHNGCAHNWLTKYFCGHKQVCSTSDASALTTAKANMLHSFAAVGILEETDLTLRVFSKVLPGFFTVADLPKFNKNQQSMVLSMEEEETVLRINSADMELYAYARELLQTTSISCHVQVTR